jgi:hypothetical protein
MTSFTQSETLQVEHPNPVLADRSPRDFCVTKWRFHLQRTSFGRG